MDLQPGGTGRNAIRHTVDVPTLPVADGPLSVDGGERLYGASASAADGPRPVRATAGTPLLPTASDGERRVGQSLGVGNDYRDGE